MLRKMRDVLRNRDDSGFSLIEVIVALVIFLIVSSAATITWMTVSRAQLNSQKSDIATKYANGIMEKARSLQWEKLGYPDADSEALAAQVPGARPVLLSQDVKDTLPARPVAIDQNSDPCIGISTGVLYSVDQFGCGSSTSGPNNTRVDVDTFYSRIDLDWTKVASGNIDAGDPADRGFGSASYGTKRVTVSVFWAAPDREGRESSRGWCMNRVTHRVFKTDVINGELSCLNIDGNVLARAEASSVPLASRDDYEFGSAITMTSLRTPTINEAVPDGITTRSF